MKINKASNDPEWEEQYIKLLEEVGNYMQAHGDEVVANSEEYLNVANAIQAFNGYNIGDIVGEVEEEEEADDEIKINLDESNIDMTNGLNDNYESLILNQEEEQTDEQLFPNDPFGQDYNYLDSIGLSDYLREAFEYTHARKQRGYQPGNERTKLDDDADAKLDELHNITKRIKDKLARKESIDKEKGNYKISNHISIN